MNNIISYLTDESGAAASEYALILGLIAVAIVASLNGLRAAIEAAINAAAAAMTPAA